MLRRKPTRLELKLDDIDEFESIRKDLEVRTHFPVVRGPQTPPAAYVKSVGCFTGTSEQRVFPVMVTKTEKMTPLQFFFLHYSVVY